MPPKGQRRAAQGSAPRGGAPLHAHGRGKGLPKEADIKHLINKVLREQFKGCTDAEVDCTIIVATTYTALPFISATTRATTVTTRAPTTTTSGGCVAPATQR